MADEFLSLVDKLRDTTLNSAGATSSDTRSKILQWASQLDNNSDAASDLPEIVKNYVRKVSLYAYKTTDEDVQRLRDAGYSEDAIFEITVAASLGAGIKRLNTGLDLLKGNRSAPQDS